jgi:hypothetical protein
MSPSCTSEAHALVYQALDQVLTDKVVTPGTPRAIFAAVDTLRFCSAPAEQVRQAEDISVQIHKLQSALQQSNERQADSALGDLKGMAAQWLETRIQSRH